MCLRGFCLASSILLALSGSAMFSASAQAAPKLQLINGDDHPPPQYLSGPTVTGRTTERTFHSRAEVHAYCSRFLGQPAEGVFYACYVPALDVVALPSKLAWPDAASRATLRDHEWAHARGWRHPLRLRTAARGVSERD